MTTFNDRERAFEKKFEQDQEVQFKVHARQNKLLGLWAAAKLGKTGADAEAYAKDVVMADFDKKGHEDVVTRLAKDLAAKAIDVGTIRKQASECLAQAKKQVMGE